MDHDHLSAVAASALMARLFAMTRELGRGRTLADPRPETLTSLLDAVQADEDATALLDDTVGILGHCLEFLDETDSWNISDEEFDASYAVLDEAEEFDEEEAEGRGILSELVGALDGVPDVPVAEQLRAMNVLRPIAGVNALLDWVGRSRTITSTGALRLGDIQPVAALIGIDAVGVKNARVENELVTLLKEQEEALTKRELAAAATGDRNISAGPREVATMWDLPELAAWWQTLIGVGVIETTATTVRPGVAANAWLSPDAPEHFALRVGVVQLYVTHWMHQELESEDLFGSFVVIHLMAQLAAAVSPDVLPELSTSAIADILHESAELAGFDLGAISAMRSAITLRHLFHAGFLEKPCRPSCGQQSRNR